MSDKAAALKEKLANLKRKRQEAKTANHRDVCRNRVSASNHTSKHKKHDFRLWKKIELLNYQKISKLEKSAQNIF